MYLFTAFKNGHKIKAKVFEAPNHKEASRIGLAGARFLAADLHRVVEVKR